ncbi:MAG TPA: hypothetical protein VH309_01125 [Elusimicrobiota bacterium]|jgi:hypothetical protein|nr:hypothetical protein [Elusimicrobiota bacterium]
MRGRAPRALLLLLGAAFLCYGGPRIARLGFYLDDWILLSFMRFAPAGFLSSASALIAAEKSLLFRPLDAPLYAALYSLFGLRPLAWQAALLLVNVLTAFAAGRVLLRYGVSERAAALGALLFLAWPDKDATMFWPFVIINSLSLLSMLAAYLAHLEYVESGRGRFLGISAALLLISLSLYDQCAFFFLLWLVTPRLLDEGVSRRARRGALAAAAAAGAFLLYKFALAPALFAIPYNKTFALSPGHFFRIFYSGLSVAFGPRLIAFCLYSLKVAFTVAPFLAGAALLYPWLLLKLPAAPSSPRPAGGRALIALGALVYLLSCLPIAVSDYSFTPINHMNRLNEVPTLGLLFVLIGLGTSKLKARVLERGACALASVLLAVHVGLSCFWVESYRRQNAVRAQVLEHLGAWPADKTLLLLLPERYVADKVPVFDANYDITGAVRVWTGDEKRRADAITPRMDFEPDGVVTDWGKLPYASCLLLVSSKDLLTKFGYRNFSRRPPKA